ncbi:MAG: hypothetical protein JO121_25810 [Deltaproteobacteria bacterium]|jgi:hypothetical protein|nr:hypothetical protein [Deltaproteobacteria bacterium]
MRGKFNFLVTLLVASAFAVVACQGGEPIVSHKLVASANQHSVPMYPDEQTYLRVSRMQQQGGIEGMAGAVRKNFIAWAIDDQTQVTVVSSDENGAVVEIAQGPMKGHSGFVAKQNID